MELSYSNPRGIMVNTNYLLMGSLKDYSKLTRMVMITLTVVVTMMMTLVKVMMILSFHIQEVILVVTQTERILMRENLLSIMMEREKVKKPKTRNKVMLKKNSMTLQH